MTDPVSTPSAPVAETPVVSAPVAAPVSTPVESAPAVAPVVEATPSLSDTTVLGADDAPVAEPKTTPDPVVEAKPVVDDKKPTDVAEKPTDVKNEEEVSQSDEPAPLPSFEPWAFPEGITADEAKVGEFNKMLGEFVVTNKLDKAMVKEFGQKLVDFNVGQMKLLADEIQKNNQKYWADQTKSWFDEFVKDPTIGGNKQDTTVQAAREFIRKHGGNKQQQDEVRTIMKTTGLGNHPALIRLFANANLNLQEGKPVPANTPVAEKPAGGLKSKMYGNKK